MPQNKTYMPTRKKLATIIKQHFLAHPSVWIPKVDFYVLADSYGHSPEAVGRRLREMEQSGEIKKSYYDSRFAKNLVQYSLGEVIKPTVKFIRIGDKMVQI